MCGWVKRPKEPKSEPRPKPTRSGSKPPFRVKRLPGWSDDQYRWALLGEACGQAACRVIHKLEKREPEALAHAASGRWTAAEAGYMGGNPNRIVTVSDVRDEFAYQASIPILQATMAARCALEATGRLHPRSTLQFNSDVDTLIWVRVRDLDERERNRRQPRFAESWVEWFTRQRGIAWEHVSGVAQGDPEALRAIAAEYPPARSPYHGRTVYRRRGGARVGRTQHRPLHVRA